MSIYGINLMRIILNDIARFITRPQQRIYEATTGTVCRLSPQQLVVNKLKNFAKRQIDRHIFGLENLKLRSKSSFVNHMLNFESIDI